MWYTIYTLRAGGEGVLPTIKDVARAVGVSPTTVSNVIRGNLRRVSPETVERIRAAIAGIGYVPNLSARSLVGGASRIIGVISRPAPLESEGPFHGALLAGIEQTLRARDYYLMMRAVDTAAELHSLLSNWNLDGLLLTGAFPGGFYRSLLSQDTPFLLLDGYVDDPNVLQVRPADRVGGYLATKHLLDNGHRGILFCGPSMAQRGAISERYEGYRQALEEHGIAPRKENVCAVEIGVEQGAALGRKLAGRAGYTALFAAAHLLAAGLISGLQAAGRRVPEEVSVVGFDDSHVARLISPPLTTVRQDAARKGAIAAELLLSAMDRSKERQHVAVLPVELVERQSVRRIDSL